MSSWTKGVVGIYSVTRKNWVGQRVHKYFARLCTMKAILFPIVNVEYCCPLRAIFGQKLDHMHERDNAHAIISSTRGC